MHEYIFDKMDPNQNVFEYLLGQEQLCRIDVRLAKKVFQSTFMSAIFEISIWKLAS